MNYSAIENKVNTSEEKCSYKKVTLKDVAEVAGVSVATVSLVINGKPNVSEEVRKKVFKAIDAVGYRTERSKGTKKKEHSFMLVVPYNIETQKGVIYDEYLEGIQIAAEELSFGITFFLNNLVKFPKSFFFKMAETELANVDGVLFTSLHPDDEFFKWLTSKDVPIVLINRMNDELGTSYVSLDYVEASKQIIAHLNALGHERIAFIGAEPNLLWVISRLQGYKEGLSEKGLKYDSDLVVLGKTGEELKMELKRLTNGQSPVTAIYAASNAKVVVQYLEELGLRVPDDISFCSADPIYNDDGIGFTGVKCPYRDIAYYAVKALNDLMKSPHMTSQRIKFKGELVVLESTKSLDR